MSKIIDFPSSPEAFRKKSELADYLRQMADYIESNSLEYQPIAISMIFTGEQYHEIVNYGYADQYLLKDALGAAYRYSRCSYKRRGGAVYDRKV